MTKTVLVTICGRPNVGKSTLINSIVGEKVAIVSNKPQTTRNRIIGVLTKKDTQFIFIDTPGYIKPRNKLGNYMVGVVYNSLKEVDCVAFIVDPTTIAGPGELALLEKISNVPTILVINKIDLIKKEEILQIIESYNKVYNFDCIIPISAKNNDGIDTLLNEIEKFSADGEHLFPDEMYTDQPERQLCAELIREKILRNLEKEVPHGIAIEITRFSERETGVVDIEATIFCEKESHKGIIIGKHGDMIKLIGSQAREDIEKMLDTKVFLQTWIKVKENWRESEVMLKNFGYKDE